MENYQRIKMKLALSEERLLAIQSLARRYTEKVFHHHFYSALIKIDLPMFWLKYMKEFVGTILKVALSPIKHFGMDIIRHQCRRMPLTTFENVISANALPLYHIPPPPQKNLTSMSTPWPFAILGIDLIGPLLIGTGGVKYVVIVVDYFTK